MKSNKLYMAAVIAVSTAMISSCHIYKKFELPDEGLSAEIAAAQKEEVDSTALGNIAWDEMFTDPQLQALIQIALDNNVDLENARLNVKIANAQLLGAKLDYLPSIVLNPTGGTSSYDGAKITYDSWSYQIPVTASWQLDLFGGLLNSKRSAQASLKMTEAQEQATRASIISSVANCYYTIVMLERQLEISRETAVLWSESVQTMKDLKEAGRYNEVAVVQAQASYNSILASIPQIETQLNQAYNTLSLLLNSTPQQWTVDFKSNPVFPEYLEEGVPLKYLAARPDVQAAEQSFAVAYYSTNLARAAFYPNITISAGGGFTNTLGSIIQNPGVWFYQLAASLTAPLFNRGTNIATLKAAKAQQEQALNTFEYTVLNAGVEVSNALVAYNNDQARVENLREQVKNLEKAVEYNKDLLNLGTATYLEVLTAQQSLLSAQLSLLQCELNISQDAISLYQALGGGR